MIKLWREVLVGSIVLFGGQVVAAERDDALTLIAKLRASLGAIEAVQVDLSTRALAQQKSVKGEPEIGLTSEPCPHTVPGYCNAWPNWLWASASRKFLDPDATYLQARYLEDERWPKRVLVHATDPCALLCSHRYRLNHGSCGMARMDCTALSPSLSPEGFDPWIGRNR